MSKPARYTITLPGEMDDEVSAFSRDSGISISDLARQGLIRVMKELRRDGTVRIEKWADEEAAVAN